MSNNDAPTAQCIAVGEELSRLMVQAEYLREENARLREALRGVIRVPDKAALDAARAALGEGKE